MRIRKVINPWRWKVFATVTGAMAILYNTFFLLAGYGRGGLQAADEVQFWLITGILMPLIIGITVTSTTRKATLSIDEHQDIPDFRTRVIHHIQETGFSSDIQSSPIITFTPTNWFYKLLRSWFGTENLDVTFGTTTTITGPTKKISELEDILSFNTDFKKPDA